MMKTVERYTISVFGEQYTIMSDDGPEAVALLAVRADALMRDIAAKTAVRDVKRISILALLKVIHQLQEFESDKQKKDHEGSQLVQYINQQLSSLSS